MNILIISDDRKEMHYLVKVTNPEDLKLPRKGQVSMEVEILGYSKTYSDAAGKAAGNVRRKNNQNEGPCQHMVWGLFFYSVK